MRLRVPLPKHLQTIDELRLLGLLEQDLVHQLKTMDNQELTCALNFHPII